MCCRIEIACYALNCRTVLIERRVRFPERKVRRIGEASAALINWLLKNVSCAPQAGERQRIDEGEGSCNPRQLDRVQHREVSIYRAAQDEVAGYW